MTQDEALKIALEALETALDFDIDAEDGYYLQAITAIKEVLAQPEDHRRGADNQKVNKQEPMAWPCLIAEADFSQDTVTLKMQCNDYKVSAGKHWLYTTPPQRKPLTDEQIWQIATDSTIGGDLHADKFARAIESRLKERNDHSI